MTDKKQNERKQTSLREVGEKVLPEHMSEQEYIHYLCYLHDFEMENKWDGVELKAGKWNLESNPAQDHKSRKEALAFLEGQKLKKEPRQADRRKTQEYYVDPNKRHHRSRTDGYEEQLQKAQEEARIYKQEFERAMQENAKYQISKGQHLFYYLCLYSGLFIILFLLGINLVHG